MSQLTRGQKRRLMYFENKDGDIDGAEARIGWATFSQTGRSIYYRGRTFKPVKGGGISGNYIDADTNEEYWISGVKKRGSNAHWAEPVDIVIDADAREEYKKVRSR
jgi:hypothetical protein